MRLTVYVFLENPRIILQVKYVGVFFLTFLLVFEFFFYEMLEFVDQVLFVYIENPFAVWEPRFHHTYVFN